MPAQVHAEGLVFALDSELVLREGWQRRKRWRIQWVLLVLVLVLVWASRLMSSSRLAFHKIRRTFVIIQTMKPFSSILYDSTVFPSCRIFPSVDRAISVLPIKSHTHRITMLHQRTGVNVLLLAYFPPFFF